MTVRLGIVGSGRVGSALGRSLASKGYQVLFYDISDRQLEPLKQDGFETTTDMGEAKNTCAFLFTAIPTESLPNGDCDLSILKSVCKQLANYPRTFVQVSTCPPRTARKMSKLMPKATYVVHPSFYSMARMEYDALHPIRLLLGSKDGRPVQGVSEIFAKFDGPMHWGTWEAVELTKYADNCLSATMITYWNQIWLLAQKLDVDSDWVARVVDIDPQFRSGYRFHQKAYGGFCLRKDLWALKNFAEKELKADARLLRAVHELNESLRDKYGENDRHIIYRP